MENIHTDPLGHWDQADPMATRDGNPWDITAVSPRDGPWIVDQRTTGLAEEARRSRRGGVRVYRGMQWASARAKEDKKLPIQETGGS